MGNRPSAVCNNRIVVIAGFAPSLLNFRGPLIRELISRGWEVTCVAPADESVAQKIKDLGAQFIPVEMKRASIGFVSDIKYMRTLCRLLRRVAPAIVLAYTVKPIIYGLSAAWLVGVQQRFALITGLGYSFGRERFQQRVVGAVVSLMYRVTLRKAQAVIFQNPDDRNEFIIRGLVEAVSCKLVDGSGVDTAYFRRSPMPEAPVFLLVARLLVDKGIREYVEAARVVKQEYPSVRFKIVGSFDSNPMGLSQQEVRGWTKEGVITYDGVLADVRPAYDVSRFYVLPSYREGMPRTVLEAMSTGRPIITTDAPGCRETVVNGLNGLLVPARDSRALAKAMLKLLENPMLAQRMGRASRDLAEQKYAVERINACMCEIMRIPRPNIRISNVQNGSDGLSV